MQAYIMRTVREMYDNTKNQLVQVRAALQDLTDELVRDSEVSGSRVREILSSHGFS